MRPYRIITIAAVLVPGLCAATLSADARRSRGTADIVKNCQNYTGQAGSYCTITSSNVSVIPAGTIVWYDLAAATLGNSALDSDAIVDAGNGNRGFAHCNLDQDNVGVCIISDGTGQFAGFHARFDVAPLSAVDYSWKGPYSFDKNDDAGE
jgi:hypothetical protein